ncbi:EF-hand domain-containing protein [Candidatus Magnetominusculus dajiuhuensis]|uniref:EF-hand domain-containing protein n=1 Tax=Candidatus Magnetominusculus dajiuhuensis TaxID=3137712 RepID=UPI003B431F15
MVSGATTGPSAADMAQMSQKMFKAMDTNGDGQISKAETQAFSDKMKARTGKQGPSVDQFFSQFDTDKSGSISQSEFDSANKQMMDKMKGMAMKMGANGGSTMNASGNTSNEDSTLLQLSAYSSTSGAGSSKEKDAQKSTSVYA